MNLWVNMSYKSKTCDESMLSYKMSYYLSNSFIERKNDDLNFKKVIKDYEAICHKSS